MAVSFDVLTQSGIEFAVPLWLAGTGELVVQRGGMVNIGIEGMMLSGALAGWVVAVTTGSPWLGLLAAGLTGMALAGVFAVVTLVFDADQVVTGTALNLLAIGATGAGIKLAVAEGWGGRQVSFFEPIHVTDAFGALNQFGLFYATILLMLAAHLFIRQTRWGVELTALGEYPRAVVSAGLRARWRRAGCVLFGGLTAGLAGSYLSIMFTHEFTDQMTAGRGFLALAMVVFGRWQPVGLLAGGLFFGYVYALQNHLHVFSRSEASPWMPPSQILEMAPYVLTLLVLAGFAGRTRPPAALAQPLERE